MGAKGCCAPRASNGDPNRPPSAPLTARFAARANSDENSRAIDFTLRDVPGGGALLGTDRPVIPVDEEGPLRRKTVNPFRIMSTVVTNAMFARFVDDTDYVTDAERYGWSYVFFDQLADRGSSARRVKGVEWWRQVEGAHWRAATGPGSDGETEPDHPVIHVSWRDGQAFAAWAGGRLPTEHDWEHAARGGLGDVRYPWGDQEPDDVDHQPCNIWQGRFPNENTALDGFLATAPARSFAPNGYGLFNMVGNVWEWTSTPLKTRSLSKSARQRSKALQGQKILKGGSFLCHKSYCFRYRIAARIGNTPDTTTSHQGFRLVFDPTPA